MITSLSQKIVCYLTMLFVIISALGCQEEADKPIAPPKYLSIDKGYQSLIEAGKVKVQTIRAMVLDSDSEPKRNVTVFFEVQDGDISLSAPSSITNSEGFASVDVTFGSKVGNATVVANSFGLEGSPATFYFDIRATTPNHITIVSGDGQEDLPGKSLKEELTVNLADEFQNPVQGATVTFRVTKSNGIVLWSSSTTNEAGNAQTQFRLGDSEPINEITAAYNDELKIVFKAYSLLPVKLAPIKNGKDHLELNWTKDLNPNYERYVVLRALQGYTNFTPVTEITDVNEVSYLDDSAVPGSKYSYYVKTVTSQSHSVNSSWEKGECGDYINFSIFDQLFDVVYDEPVGRIYVSNTAERRIMILSMETFEKIDSIQLDDPPRHISLSSDRERLYVTLSNTGSFGVIQLSSKSVIKKVDISSALGTSEIVDIYQASTGELFATSVGKYTVKINEADNTAQRVASDNVFFNTASYFVGDDGEFLYTEKNSGSPDELLKLDLTQDDVPLVLNIRTSGTESACLSPDGKRVYLLGGGILDTQDFSSIGVLGTGSRIALSKDGLHFYTVNAGFINVYNTNTQLLERQVPFGLEAFGLFINASGSTAIIQTNSYYPSPYFTRLYRLSIAD